MPTSTYWVNEQSRPEPDQICSWEGCYEQSVETLPWGFSCQHSVTRGATFARMTIELGFYMVCEEHLEAVLKFLHTECTKPYGQDGEYVGGGM